MAPLVPVLISVVDNSLVVEGSLR